MPDNQRKITNPIKLFLYIPVPWVYILGYLAGLIPQYFYPLVVQTLSTRSVIKTCGVLLFVVGALFAAWSLLIFRKAHTTTTPGESSSKLVTEGPYRISRNPMYVSLALAYLGEAGILVQFWPLLMLPVVLAYVNWVVIPLEEVVLKGDFKDDYEEYCRRVRRWL